MATELRYVATVTDGKPIIHGRKQFDNDLKSFEGERILLKVSKYKRSRTNKQNSVLHWYISEISEETGMATETIKEVLKMKFLTETAIDSSGNILVDEQSGEVLRFVKSTTDLTTIQFNEFTENIRIWANEFLGLQLPLPNEESELKFK